MDNMGCVQVPPVVRKGKKKQAKDELDRLKQAEKKKRRLEKALATSAAIRSELEKKKQRKKEEQQRLDEEGAAIAEAVALHVLGEDSDDSCKIMLKQDEGFNPWNQSNMGFYRGGWRANSPHQGYTKYSVEGFGWASEACGSECKWNDWGISSWSLSPNSPYFEERGRGMTELSAGLIAAQAVSSLQIAEDACADAIVINGMFKGKFSSYSNQV
ncbi:hypothetical protein BVC80_1787g32 [Macleaya cordata]|uniref:Uncharacterized protein n=1 Tax=Macleaya cordata TaxID=56857 RepID=A0A200QU30_MACCD|nr:hypothetical protein BVC80_1787g32 [Macleaya cordata]